MVELVGHIWPAVLWQLLGLLVGVRITLSLLKAIVNGFTSLRRAIRDARVSARIEGWGSPRPHDAELAAELERTERAPLEAAARRIETR
jgi:hypothetical protein